MALVSDRLLFRVFFSPTESLFTGYSRTVAFNDIWVSFSSKLEQNENK